VDHRPGRGHLYFGEPGGRRLIAASGSRRRPSRSTRPFFDLDPAGANYRTAATVIIPAPYEGTVSYGRGAAKGPDALRRASWEVEYYDPELGRDARLALASLPPLPLPRDPKTAIARVEKTAAKILKDGKRPLLIGGEHSLTLGMVRAARRRYPRLSVLQLDAHADLRERYDQSPYSHACVMRRVAELGLPIVAAGVRSLSREEHDWIREHRQKIFWAGEIKRNPGWTKAVIRGLGPEVYLSLDVDVLDPAEMPATGAPEPGGLSWRDLLDLFRALAASGKKVIGLDLVELAPIPGFHAPDFLCARLLFFLLARLDP